MLKLRYITCKYIPSAEEYVELLRIDEMYHDLYIKYGHKSMTTLVQDK